MTPSEVAVVASLPYYESQPNWNKGSTMIVSSHSHPKHSVPPVLGVWWRILKADEGVAGGVEGEAPDAVSPFLLSPVGEETNPKMMPAAWNLHTITNILHF